MASTEMKTLYQHLVEARFAFLPDGVHSVTYINGVVKARCPELCNDSIPCEHSTTVRPEWKHVVRQVLRMLKDTQEAG